MYLFDGKLNIFVLRTYWYFMVAAGVLAVIFSFNTNFIYCICFVIICYTALLTYGATVYKDETFAEFAQRHQWTYFGNNNNDAAVSPTGLIFHTGSNQRISTIARGENATLCSLEYSVAISENHYQTFFWTVLQLTLPATCPHIVLDSMQDFFSAQPDAVPDCEKIELEGDFGNHFKVAIQKGSSVESLTILSPDTMALLIDNDKSYSIELLDDTAIFMFEGILDDSDSLEALYEKSTQFVASISPKIQRMALNR